jgi:hypothetical protein
MKFGLFKASLFFLPIVITTIAYPQSKISPSNIPKTGDEFVGPFNSWLNAKTGFGAKGDGITDDTNALQVAFDTAAKGTINSTLYLPAGTYLITRTLTMNYHVNVSVIGADPATTIIKWGGGSHGTMMQVSGTAYSKFDRITWNGNQAADVAVEQSWDGRKGTFDTANEYADDVFTDVAFGIRGGALGHGFAETTILRNKFIRNTSAGISLGNFNALDVWVSNCLFRDCAIGVTNVYGAGNFRLYHNVFRNSANTDIVINNTGGFSIRENTSICSKQFFYAIYSRNPATTIIEGNTVIDPVNTQAITIGNQGPTIFVNNTIRSLPSASGLVAVFSSGNNSDTFLMGNKFTVANPVYADAGMIEFNDQVVPRNNLVNLTEPVLPGAGPNLHRKVFEVPVGANADAIQAIINKASLETGTRPVVHFPYGNYNITGTIFIPANADLQLVGDGYGVYHGSILAWAGTGTGPVISINGPGKATLRDLTIKGNAATTNILITNADQPGSRIYLQEFNQIGGQTGLLSNQLNHTLVLGFSAEFSGLKKAISVVGGPFAAAGKPAEGRTIIYSGAESNNSLSHEVTNGGNLLIQDTWYEGGVKSTYAKLTGKGIFTAAGDMIAVPQHTDAPAVLIHDFSGKASFIANDFSDRFAVSGNSSGSKILALGTMAESYPFVADTSTAKADMRVLLSRTRINYKNAGRSGSYATDDNGTKDQAFITNMLANALNVHFPVINALPTGVTDVRFYRVMSIGGAVGLDIEPGKIPGGGY